MEEIYKDVAVRMVNILKKQNIALNVHSWEWTLSWVFFFFFVTYIVKYKDLSNQKENSSQSRHNRLKLIHHNFPISLGGHLAGSRTLSVWLTESLQLMEFSPLFVVAMVTQYSQACHVHRSVAAAPLQTHNCSQLLTIDKNSLRSQSVRKEVATV